MKVAVASSDGTSISRHFGQSACFIVFDVEDGKVTRREVRDNTYTAHAQGNCQGHEHGDHHHSHSAIVDAFHDCEAILCLGMGWRAAQDMAANGIKPYVLEQECTPESAVTLFVEGRLPGGGSDFCRCHGQPDTTG